MMVESGGGEDIHRRRAEYKEDVGVVMCQVSHSEGTVGAYRDLFVL